jgi:hypothetical protein
MYVDMIHLVGEWEGVKIVERQEYTAAASAANSKNSADNSDISVSGENEAG